jgi:hypothetical protein
MKPELRHFFEQMGRFFEGPGDARGVGGLRDAFPGWDPPEHRLTLYARFVQAHPRVMLEKNHPLTREALGEPLWAELASGFCRAAPPRSHELNQAAEGFAAFLGDAVPARGLPAFVPALARFELAEFTVFAADVDLPARVAAPAPNPTLMVLEHPYRLVPWMLAQPRPSAPEQGAETVLLWRHPRTHRARFRVAEAGALLALKIALEGIAVSAAADEAGMTEPELGALLGAYAAEGLILLPPTS